MYSHAATYFDPDNNIWSGPKVKPVFSSEMTLGDMILYRLSMSPKNIVQVFDPTGETLTAGELLQQSKAVAMNFIKMGLSTGDVIGIAAANSPNMTAIVIGAFLCGTPIHPVYQEFDKETMKEIYDVSKPKLLMCDIENYDVVKQVEEELGLDAKIFLFNGKTENVQCASDFLTCSQEPTIENFPCSKLHGSSLAMIMCSSGTSGLPKGIICTHTFFLNQDTYFNVNEESVLFTFSSLNWITSVLTMIASFKVCAKRILTNHPSTGEYFIELIEKHQITHIISNPIQIAQLNSAYKLKPRSGLNSLHAVYCGGAKVSESVIKTFDEILGDVPRPGLCVVFAMTEVGGYVALNDEGPGKRPIVNGGRVCPNNQIRIVDEAGNNLGIGEQGMIYIKPPYPFSGYLKNDEATKKALDNGWIISGDIGYFDENGYLNVCARESEIFKAKRLPILSSLIENVIMELEGVLDVCVFGIPDDMEGNLIACAVEVNNGKKLTQCEIELQVKAKMDKRYHLNGGVFFVDALPRTSTGKIMRRKMLEVIKYK